MKRILKWVAFVLCVLLSLPVLAVLFVFGFYYSVVSPVPRTLMAKETPAALGSLTTMVNPFIGTGGVPFMGAYNPPAASMPFSMVRLGPDTASILTNWQALNRSGYYYGDNKILGFSHTRLVGADSQEGGVFRVFPTVESRVAKIIVREKRFARFSHRDEQAYPGFYSVRLPKDDVRAEMTVTPRTGVHRYTFGGSETPHLLIDITSAIGNRRTENAVAVVRPEKQEVEGTVRLYGSFSGRYDGLDVFFVARCNQSFTQYGTWSAGRLTAGSATVSGKDIGVDLAFARQGPRTVVEMQLALSYVSIANARLNLEDEAATKGFDGVVSAAGTEWEKRLSRIFVQGGTPARQRIFYTALYRTFQMPTVFNDVNGDYIGFDRAVRKADKFQYYTDLSLWDTVRSVHPLYNLIARSEQRDMMCSLVEMVKAGGCLPRWPSGCGYTNCMFGTPADIAVSEAWQKGVQDFDVQTAYRSMRQVALEGVPEGSRFAGRGDVAQYNQLGYEADEASSKSVSKTLEYCWEDYAISQLAAALGYKEDADLFARHAQFYRNLWNPATKYFQPRDAGGAFFNDFKPLLLSYADFGGKYTKAYCEGSAEQWRWAVPFDPDGLISLFGGPEPFVKALTTFFEKSTKGVGVWNPGPYYWHGNEPDIFSVYLFNSAGRPDLTQKWARWILDTKYADKYYGLDGNDDGGTLSAWYVLSSLGFYPVAGTTKYQVGSPLFDKAVVQMGEGKVLTVVAENNSPTNVYVQQLSINGTPLGKTWFDHADITGGGELRFVMGPDPAKR
jgi:predicted alpha-1,2-mannosidase